MPRFRCALSGLVPSSLVPSGLVPSRGRRFAVVAGLGLGLGFAAELGTPNAAHAEAGTRQKSVGAKNASAASQKQTGSTTPAARHDGKAAIKAPGGSNFQRRHVRRSVVYPNGCPADMVRVRDFCIDRWEVSTVDQRSGELLSPFYPPQPKLLERVHRMWLVERLSVGDDNARALSLPLLPEVQRSLNFEARAVSRPNVLPQGYLSYYLAQQVCENSGKRLCQEEEWVLACKGQRQTLFPYGESFEAGKCNVFRSYHPAHVLHGNSSIGHLDPRLNLVIERGQDPLLRVTGSTETCASQWGDDAVYDMVGNLDEWVADPSGVFVGGFYARATQSGCESRIASHSSSYYDYSTGTRCCKSAAL